MENLNFYKIILITQNFFQSSSLVENISIFLTHSSEEFIKKNIEIVQKIIYNL